VASAIKGCTSRRREQSFRPQDPAQGRRYVGSLSLAPAQLLIQPASVIRLKQVEHVRNERNVLAKVAGHPFITTMVASFQSLDSLYMVLDYCPGGEVFSYLRRARRFNEPTSQFYAAEIVLILEFLHEREGVAYRDLKPENILIDAEGHLKLVDFGFAKKVDNSASDVTIISARKSG